MRINPFTTRSPATGTPLSVSFDAAPEGTERAVDKTMQALAHATPWLDPADIAPDKPLNGVAIHWMSDVTLSLCDALIEETT